MRSWSGACSPSWTARSTSSRWTPGAWPRSEVLHSSRSAAVDAAFRRETAVLGHLDGADAPRLLGSGSVAGGAWMLLEWCAGVPAGVAAAALRRSADGAPGLLALGRRIAQAYARLHASGVVHGDVHPGNLIVSPDGDVRIVDFGLARGPGLAVPPRGGAPRYVAPDQARAMLTGTAPGPATESSDQYCLAVVLYEVFTGHSYLDFALDKDEMLRQVAEDPPLPFTRAGAALLAGGRGAAARGAGQGSRRPAGFGRGTRPAAGRRESFRPRAPGPARTMSGTVAGPWPASGRCSNAVLADARPGGRWFTGGLPTAPLVSVAYGTAGLAVALHHVATFRDDPELAALADEWALRAAAEATGDAVFEQASYELTEAVTGRVTPFHRRSGIHAVQALVSHSLGNGGVRQAALDGYVAESRQPCENLDLVLGRSGTLLGAAILHEAIGGAGPTDQARPTDQAALAGLAELGNDTLRDIWAELDTLPPIADGTQQRRPRRGARVGGFPAGHAALVRVVGVPRPAGRGAAGSAGRARPARGCRPALAMDQRRRLVDAGLVQRQCRVRPPVDRGPRCVPRPAMGRPGRTGRLGRLPDARHRPALLWPGRPGVRAAGALPAHRRAPLADRGDRARRPRRGRA